MWVFRLFELVGQLVLRSGKEKGELACERGEKPAHKRSDCINRRGVVEDIAPTGPKVRAVKVESNAKRAAH